jgi:hypothetical protein
MRKYTIAAACAAASTILACGAASADPTPDSTAVVPQAVIGGDYSHVWLNRGLGDANIYGVNLGGITPLGGDFRGQVAGGYHRLDASGGGADEWNVAGTVAMSLPVGRIGANVGYVDAGLSGISGHVTNYGVYGEYYASPAVTLGLRGGGLTASANAFGFGGSRDGGYVGGEGIGYLTPNFAARATIGYVGVAGGHQWTAGVHGEYLLSEKTPLSAWVGYDYANLGGNGFSVRGNTLSVGLKFYLGGGGSLEQHQRTGEDDWGPANLDLTH